MFGKHLLFNLILAFGSKKNNKVKRDDIFLRNEDHLRSKLAINVERCDIEFVTVSKRY